MAWLGRSLQGPGHAGGRQTNQRTVPVDASPITSLPTIGVRPFDGRAPPVAAAILPGSPA